MSEDQNLPEWRKKFLATRMTFESILFERELLVPQKEKFSTGLLWLGGIWLLHALLLAQWALRRGYFFTQADAVSFNAVLHYASYLQTQGLWALVKPEFSGLSLNPPLYYLAYVPVLKYLTSDLNLALIAVNSFFLLVIALSVFLAVRKSRPNSSGWLGAAFALALPFVQEAARRPSPELALLAMVAAMYSCYIRSDEFEHAKWTFAFALCASLGFYSHQFFWLYFLPLLPFIGAGFASPYSRDELFKGMFPGVVLNLPSSSPRPSPPASCRCGEPTTASGITSNWARPRPACRCSPWAPRRSPGCISPCSCLTTRTRWWPPGSGPRTCCSPGRCAARAPNCSTPPCCLSPWPCR